MFVIEKAVSVSMWSGFVMLTVFYMGSFYTMSWIVGANCQNSKTFPHAANLKQSKHQERSKSSAAGKPPQLPPSKDGPSHGKKFVKQPQKQSVGDESHPNITTEVSVSGKQFRKNDSYIALCVCVKDEPDLEEWLAYHVNKGVSKIYLFENNSTIPMPPSVGEYVSSGHVNYEFVENLHPSKRGGMSNQQFIYKRCLSEHSNDHQFIGFIDVDEFIVVKDLSMDIPSILHDFEGYGGLTLNWMMIGYSGHLKRPSGGVLANYNQCVPYPLVKTIVNTNYCVDLGKNVHAFRYAEGYGAVDIEKKPVLGHLNGNFGSRPPDYLFQKMFIRHYVSKSLEDFAFRVAVRGTAGHRAKTWDFFIEVNSEMTEDCGFLSSTYSKAGGGGHSIAGDIESRT